jgi:hypothetical protein
MSLIDRIERSPFWLIGRLLIPRRRRRAACIARGTHHPKLIDLGYRKMCFRCGTW